MTYSVLPAKRAEYNASARVRLSKSQGSSKPKDKGNLHIFDTFHTRKFSVVGGKNWGLLPYPFKHKALGTLRPSISTFRASTFTLFPGFIPHF